ncbi:TonB-dependent receptor [Flavobacterium okayamense]|uniref:TonB-dependent receptor n=1 Tax=Flavobacterium okayamense TaxID=2830782 RepID=A0ABM7S806_9FLAO|nr:TonB-dependent receptor [Flavobacterium okayamense]BCY28845.1 TonB-dependent receptor [Flavobacterium okayamense]
MKHFLLISFLSISFLAKSQEIKGTINDTFGNPIVDVNIYNLSSSTHAHSNEFGNFILSNVAVNDTLKFSKLGYKSSNYIVASLSEKIQIVLEEDVFRLSEIILSPNIDINSNITKIDLTTNPVNSSQEILRKVPGLFIGQHAGGGKAEQLFLRGFDIDHGTDVSITSDGIPVNMPSHAHGQGYADLHFVIPETIENINFGKGPYYASKGNFATAAYVDFSSKDKLDTSKLSIEAGQFNTIRTVGLFDLLGNTTKSNAYIATEYILTDGPFESPQNFNRFNLFGKYTTILDNRTKLSVIASHFKSKWDASGQIPMRLVNDGTISRFGAVDDTEGGFTSRTNLSLNVDKKLDENSSIKSNVYFSKYDFTLFSNFTFFLEDPINGDQIKQKEDRTLYGFNSEYRKNQIFESFNLSWQAGIGAKINSNKDIELSHTLNRNEVLEYKQLGDIEESNLFGYFNADFKFNKFTINPALRLEYFKFNYQDKLNPNYKTLSNDKAKLLPKLNFSYAQNEKVVYFLKTGIGFHSNDTRVVLQQNKDVLPSAYGADLGVILKPTDNLIINSALWTLFSEQEFVYVGDAGIVEPSGKSKRYGVDLGLRYQLNDFLFFDFDSNYSLARSVDEPSGQNYIPLAPKWTSVGGISVRNYKRFSGSIQYRYLGDRPANEDNSIIAEGYFVTDLNMNYQLSKSFNVGLIIQNLFDTEWNETQFLTESQLQNESQPVEEIHFTPGTPFFAKIKVTYSF